MNPQTPTDDAPGTVLFPEYEALYDLIAREVIGLTDAQLDFRADQWTWADWSIRRQLSHMASLIYGWIVVRWGQTLFPSGDHGIEDVQGLEVLVNPLSIIEVLSASTEAYDRGIKFFDYQSIASFQEYVLVAQDCPHITHYVRQEHGQWLRSDFYGVAEHLFLRALDCAIPMTDIYRQVLPLPQDEP